MKKSINTNKLDNPLIKLTKKDTGLLIQDIVIKAKKRIDNSIHERIRSAWEKAEKTAGGIHAEDTIKFHYKLDISLVMAHIPNLLKEIKNEKKN